MNIHRRLETLEEAAWTGDEADEKREKERWLSRARIRRTEALSERDADHARSLIALYRVQNILENMDAEELIERILAWNPKPENGRQRGQVAREVYLAIYRKEQGTGHMECPSAWSEAFAAGDELLRRYESIPDGELAKAYLKPQDTEEETPAERAWGERYGFTRELEIAACGPDADEITEAERDRRLEEYIAPAIYGEKGYRVIRHMERLEKVYGGEDGS
jgi:hypothetical protein